MFDLLIRGGTVVTPNSTGHFDVAVSGERIVEIAAPGVLPVESSVRIVDAAGKIVIPGGIDPHIHANWALPSHDGTPAGFSADSAHVSRAALLGGTTTWIDFAIAQPGLSLQQSIETRDAEWRGNCSSDYAFHVMLSGGVSPETLAQMPEAIQAGFPSFKMFTTDITPSRRGRKLLMGDIWETMQILARHGGISAIHAEDDDLVMHEYAKHTQAGRTAFEFMSEVHSSLSEDLSFRRVIRLAEHVDGAAIYLMHVSAATGVQAIAEARDRGQPVYGETLHHYALYTRADYRRPNGQIYHTYPSLKEASDARALWNGMETGAIQTIATDGICTSLEVKVRGHQIDDVTGGNAGVQPRVGVMYTESISRGYSLERFVDLVSTNAARIFGLYPRKGAILPGSDADLVLIDPTQRRKLRREELQDADYSPWEGWDVTGWPSMTILRGRVVMENGVLAAEPTYGTLIPRKVPGSVFGP